MRTVYGVSALTGEWPSSTVCIGVFDGVHLGHQQVLRTAIADARAHGRPAIVVTFDQHPLAVLRPERKPQLISAPDAVLTQFAKLGLDVAVVLPFTAETAKTTAQEFFDKTLKGKLKAETIVIGEDFAFGHNREGDKDWIRQRCKTIVVPPVEMDGERVSSTRIRNLVREGDVAFARRLLDAPYTLTGVVVPGRQLGKTLGIPTANLAPLHDQVLPRIGIYAGQAHTNGATFDAAISIGERPTVEDAGFAIEAHLLDWEEFSLYGNALSLSFWSRIRDEARFDSLEELAAQMKRDVDSVRSALEVASAG
ncbi:bifunctional riboflavin kinase/FAD synthetase [Fimbriimonadia bacterium ATM]|nr:MAG: bifunctional riboflavin kinase/FAD synthetase [Armatimonadota bacterium]MBC6968527.1 bifunctional riboflavin kinase/FAD synthetase [Armatimonadota bacterium]MCE7898634.1 bifunctional riboflavin kinase/FAD synthetase [Armatimonadetes bacterium ATM1]MDL1928073.1 bifunctional riboflavin kinase/FAD synthetase [Fimbriimonadia bacterium ATM]RIJ98357.1 MAG: hypothetical protein DCC45_00910 [Armatimonadota bacterium]